MMPSDPDITAARCDCNDQSLRESMLGAPPMASTPKAGPSRGTYNSEPGAYRPDDSVRGMPMPDPEEVKRFSAKLARFSRPIDQVIGVRSEPIRYYQTIMELKPTRRLVGEIAFQLDRRILDYVFSGDDSTSANSKARKKRYYGYTVTHIFDKIRAECKDSYGIPNLKREMAMRYRLEFLMKRLAPLGYKLELHAPFSQDMVNKFGLLSSPPERKTLDNFGLEDPRVLRMLVSKLMIFDDELKNTLILLDCLCLMAHEDGGPLFKW
ncbi:speriolin-like protein [Liolophura sinensis]|uniref:speriolin-like protein n=1 Tax=Liolophura sinensis TaxID=3198878 RepID=UPI00315923B0